MKWTSWYCDNDNGSKALSEVKQNTDPQAVYWIEQNTVYYNSSCITDSEGNYGPVNQCLAFTEVYGQAIKYQQEHSSSPNFLMPSYCPID